MRSLVALAALLLVPAARPLGAKQEEDRLAIDSITEDFERRWEKTLSEKNWSELLQLFDGQVEKLKTTPNLLAQPDPDIRRWLRFTTVYGDRLAAVLPEKEREEREILAQELLDTLPDRDGRARVIEKYCYTKAGRRAIELAANSDFDDGRLRDAIRGWSRAMELRLSPELVARLGHAHARLGDLAALSALRLQTDQQKLRGSLSIGGRTMELGVFLSGLTPPPAPPRTSDAEPARPPAAPTNEIPLGYLELKPDGGPLGRRDGGLKEWSMRPAIARVNGQERVLFTNGLRVVAFDPAAAEGGPLDDTVLWRWPRESNLRYWMPTNFGPPSPTAGITVAEGRAFATMFSAQSRQAQVGRRPDRFEGPGALRAFDPGTGTILWDTDTLEVEVDGSRRKMIEELPFGRLNFCFSGPPLARGNALYVAAMTVTPDRQVYLLRLEAETGLPRWCTWIGTAPATRERTSIPTFSEDDGTIIVSTNFGVIAAVEVERGQIDWLVKYSGQGSRIALSPPVFHHSLVYILAQDCDQPLVYDRWTGREVALPPLSQEVAWLQVTRLLGRAGDTLVFTGSTNLTLQAATGRVTLLGESETPRPAAGLLADGWLYLPTRSMIHLHDTTTWKRRDSFPWPGGEEAGQLVLGETLAVYAGERLDFFTSPGALQARFDARVNATPPRAEPCRQLARILEGSGRLRESVTYYRRALSVWEKDPAWSERTQEMKKKLADLAEKLGDDFPKD